MIGLDIVYRVLGVCVSSWRVKKKQELSVELPQLMEKRLCVCRNQGDTEIGNDAQQVTTRSTT
jgi:hypothetical protein